MPLYNEEKTLAKSVETIIAFLSKSRFPYPYGITLANNASSDGSLDICRDLARKHKSVRVLDIGIKGKGHAVRTAWSQSEAEVLSFMDVDLASDLNFFRPLIEEVRERRSHIAIGNRLGRDSVIVSRHPFRKFASHVYNFCARTVLGTDFDDHQCGFKAIDKAAFERLSPHLTERGWFFDTELLAYAVKHGYKVTSIDLVWNEGEESKVNLFSDSLKMFGDIIRLKKRL